MVAPSLCVIGCANYQQPTSEDIKTVQYGWPLGMPLVRKMDKDLWEVRIHLQARIARVLFTVSDGKIVLLHGFIKKSQATPQPDLKLAKDRMRSE